MNKWFKEVFMQRIFDQCGGPCRGKWLSQKQTAVCVSNMEQKTMRFDADGYGTMCTHLYFTAEWKGRNVTLQYSKKNSCGRIEFGRNAAEAAEAEQARSLERERIKAESAERAKRNPERLALRIADINKRIKIWTETYEMDLEDGETELVKHDLAMIAELQAELALYA